MEVLHSRCSVYTEVSQTAIGGVPFFVVDLLKNCPFWSELPSQETNNLLCLVKSSPLWGVQCLEVLPWVCIYSPISKISTITQCTVDCCKMIQCPWAETLSKMVLIAFILSERMSFKGSFHLILICPYSDPLIFSNVHIFFVKGAALVEYVS